MALKGYVTHTSYMSIDNISYDKNSKTCGVSLSIYKSKEDRILLARHGVSIDGSILVPAMLSLDTVDEITNDFKKDLFFIVGKNPQGLLFGLEGRVARISPTGRVDSYELQNNRFLFYVEDVKKYYRYSNDKWEEVLDMCSDKRIWDKWMAPEVALAEGTNPTKQMYKFMKTLDMFKDCGDC